MSRGVALLCCCWASRGSAGDDLALPTAACPCANASLCRTPTTVRQREVFGFEPGEHWRGLDWEQVTTVKVNLPLRDPQIVCAAHAAGARLVVDYGSHAADPMPLSPSAAVRAAWIHRLLATLRANWLDGVTFAFESPLDKTPGSATSVAQQSYVRLVNETTHTLHREIPGSQVSVCVAWSPGAAAHITPASRHLLVCTWFA
jgi:di-N-acetylchitobiase